MPGVFDLRRQQLHATTAQINGTLEQKLKEYTRVELLLLDELGYLPIDKRGADLMFQVIAARYECGSIVITTNRMFRDWGKIFDVDNTLATAIIDRLMHHGEALVIDGESYRTRDQDDAWSTCSWFTLPRAELIRKPGPSRCWADSLLKAGCAAAHARSVSSMSAGQQGASDMTEGRS